ncbi:glutathione S-transferase family protein [Roseospirillum parvum]|uniref:Glutathione S-transferase n=1 Tax=Roseospirillum parvum TaxID=83401 RepID=A0A1G7UDT3_9PROT|nr:glutathione S-transferase family protein [Roseospirillum parvum]SDG45229.1 Glutathione S-transferase [Roseospirillum parvum]
MHLIGRYISPYVRRVGVSLNLLGLPYELVVKSVVDDFDELRATANPLGRVPVLVLDDGEQLVESGAILDHLDELVGPERALIPAAGAPRRAVLQVTALATGACDKAVSAYYERTRRPPEFTYLPWVERCRTQITGALRSLEQRAARGDWLVGGGLTQADVSAVVAHDFIAIVEPEVLTASPCPALAALSARLNGLEAFARTAPDV